MHIPKFLAAVVALIGIVVGGCIAVVTQPLVHAIRSQAPDVDSARLETYVKHLSVDLYPRSYDQFAKIDLAAQYILNEFKSAGATVSIQDVAVEEARYKNVVARFGPASGDVPNSVAGLSRWS